MIVAADIQANGVLESAFGRAMRVPGEDERNPRGMRLQQLTHRRIASERIPEELIKPLRRSFARKSQSAQSRMVRQDDDSADPDQHGLQMPLEVCDDLPREGNIVGGPTNEPTVIVPAARKRLVAE